MIDRAKCIVLVPANFGIEPECERALAELQRRGYAVSRIPGYAAIDQCRNQAATDALAHGFEELFWLDADIDFHPDALDRLRSHNLPIVSAMYPKKNCRALASRLFPTTKEVLFGTRGGLLEILYAATGFLLTRREVYEAIQLQWKLPVCNEQFGRPMVPFFMPMVVEEAIVNDERLAAAAAERPRSKPWYLADDFAFCHRARGAGYKIFADTTIRLGHIGRYTYSWEEAGGSQQRYGTYRYQVLDAEP